jgi:hypothetical protein
MTTLSPKPEKDARRDSSASSDGNTATVRFLGPKHLRNIVSTCRAVINNLVPIGYEDETGFHYCGRSEPADCLNWAI